MFTSLLTSQLSRVSSRAVDAADDLLVTCESGLRLNVTVKSSNCHVAGDVMCSDRGLCLTQHAQVNFCLFLVSLINDSALECVLIFELLLDVILRPLLLPVQSDYTCYCCGKYQGKYCEQYTTCPCQNGGTCLEHSKSQGGYSCACRHGGELSFLSFLLSLNSSDDMRRFSGRTLKRPLESSVGDRVRKIINKNKQVVVAGDTVTVLQVSRACCARSE